MTTTPLIPFICRSHGEVLSTFATATVWCRCGKKCKPEAEVTVTDPSVRRAAADRKRKRLTRASVRTTSQDSGGASNLAGAPC